MPIKIKNYNYHRFNHLFVFFLQYLLIKQINNIECPKNAPILKDDGSCVSQYCTEEDFKQGICIIKMK